MAKTELLAKDVAADRLGISVRRLMEISAEGKLTRHRQYDPAIKRETSMFSAAEVERLAKEWTMALVPAPGFPPMPADPLPAAKHKPWVNLETASEITGLSTRLLVRLIHSGKLAALDEHTPGHSRWRVHRAALDAITGELVASEDSAGVK